MPCPPPEDLPNPGINLHLLRLLHWQVGSLLLALGSPNYKSDHVILLATTFLWLSIIFRIKPRLLVLVHRGLTYQQASQDVTSLSLCLSLAHLTVPTSGPLHQLLPLRAGPLPWILMRLDPFSLNILPQKDFPHHSSSLQSEVASQSFFFRTFT